MTWFRGCAVRVLCQTWAVLRHIPPSSPGPKNSLLLGMCVKWSVGLPACRVCDGPIAPDTPEPNLPPILRSRSQGTLLSAPHLPAAHHLLRKQPPQTLSSQPGPPL
ncbi:hypothetical protein AAFF_G00282600 [Aldrovandia affinis]|uniref:Uncharacterized protein n=1 Tax=Aldrovandia affinis TaxID=143900 RepID=A0AAD7TB20_9TELE|nr:hypothetical protein AAFF_G00282600 [Aldrovandia affinis]